MAERGRLAPAVRINHISAVGPAGYWVGGKPGMRTSVVALPRGPAGEVAQRQLAAPHRCLRQRGRPLRRCRRRRAGARRKSTL
eukprot:scaffold303823_cov24-Tisochrysis_lutea.AAC.1